MFSLHETIKKLSYKPGWSFSQEYFNTGRSALWITATVTNSRKPDTQATFTMRRTIPEAVAKDLEAFLSWWKDMLWEAEYHELREFARYDGNLIDDPHKMEKIE